MNNRVRTNYAKLCDLCHGTGWREPETPECDTICPVCQGQGKIQVPIKSDPHSDPDRHSKKPYVRRSHDEQTPCDRTGAVLKRKKGS